MKIANLFIAITLVIINEFSKFVLIEHEVISKKIINSKI